MTREDVARQRSYARVQRINKIANLGDMLYSYGYDIYPDQHREQQFRCDLHGEDNKPSARFYPETNSTYCWVCQKARGPVDYYVEKESVSFHDALVRLERLHGLPELPWSEGKDAETVANWIDSAINLRVRTFEEDRRRLRKILETTTHERDLSMDATLKYWEVFDRIDHGMRKESWTATQGREALQRLRASLMEALKCSPD